MNNEFYNKKQELPIVQSGSMNLRLSKEMYDTPEAAIEELIQNSVDAEAKNIIIHTGKKGISFFDDGIGMNKKRIEAFCTQGTKYKIINKFTKKGKKVMGNKGIGRYAIFKLTEQCTCNTRTLEHPPNECSSWELDIHGFVVGKTLTIIPKICTFNTGTRYVMTKLTSDGVLLTKRLKELKDRIIRNWNLEEYSIYINDERLKPEDIKYEKGFFEEYNRSVSGVYITGKIGLVTKEGNTSGILIKVNGRGVGNPKNFIDSKYTSFYSRIRGMLNIDAFSNIINVGRNGFIETEEKYQVVDKFIKEELKKILDKKLQQQEEYKELKFMNELTNFFKELAESLEECFEKYLGGRKVEGEGEIDVGDVPIFKQKKPLGHRKPHKVINQPDVDGGIDVNPNSHEGQIKLGDYWWTPDKASLGTDEKIVIANYDNLKVLINTDHPAFEVFRLPKNLPFLAQEIYLAINSVTDEFSNEELRDIIDKSIMRKMILKNREVIKNGSY